MLKKWLPFVTVCLSFVMVSLAARSSRAEAGTGDEWLSWSPAQRASYVDGFISGHLNATHSVCDAADELFEVDMPHSLGDAHHPSEYPSARCFAKADTYSRFKVTGNEETDFAAYTTVITEFYK